MSGTAGSYIKNGIDCNVIVARSSSTDSFSSMELNRQSNAEGAYLLGWPRAAGLRIKDI